jgi:hypothetical protein
MNPIWNLDDCQEPGALLSALARIDLPHQAYRHPRRVDLAQRSAPTATEWLFEPDS